MSCMVEPKFKISFETNLCPLLVPDDETCLNRFVKRPHVHRTLYTEDVCRRAWSIFWASYSVLLMPKEASKEKTHNLKDGRALALQIDGEAKRHTLAADRLQWNAAKAKTYSREEFAAYVKSFAS